MLVVLPTRRAAALLVALAGFLCATPVAAITEGRTAQDRPFVSGGVSTDEIAELNAKRPFFTLSVLTAARGSGAHLASVRVRIVNAKGDVVLETEMDGPYLFADLTSGNYQIEARHGDEVQKRAASVREGARRDIVLYFKSDAEISPDLKR